MQVRRPKDCMVCSNHWLLVEWSHEHGMISIYGLRLISHIVSDCIVDVSRNELRNTMQELHASC